VEGGALVALSTAKFIDLFAVYRRWASLIRCSMVVRWWSRARMTARADMTSGVPSNGGLIGFSICPIVVEQLCIWLGFG